MKVIIVEVTRAANSFGRTHLPEIRRAYDLIAKIVADAQRAGDFRKDVDPEFASMWFYGAIEQLLSGWVFELIPGADGDFDRARKMVVETICGGLETPAHRAGAVGGSAMWESLATSRRSGPRPPRRGEAAQPGGRADRAARLARRPAAQRPLPRRWRASTRAAVASRRAAPRALDGRADGGSRVDPAPAPPLRGRAVRKGLADISTFVLAQQREAANLGYAYPAQFSDHVFQGADGEHIAATRRPARDAGGPG